MKKYQFNHDGLILVQQGDALYCDTPENFEADAGRSVIGSPGLVFVIDGPQCRITADGNQSAHGLTAPQRAAVASVIESVPALLAARAARLQALIDASIAALPVDQRRALEYSKEGATVEALTVALWEKIVEGRDEAANALQLKRAAVKAELPK